MFRDFRAQLHEQVTDSERGCHTTGKNFAPDILIAKAQEHRNREDHAQKI